MERYRRARAEYEERHRQLAAGEGVPDSVVSSPSARRQWISDELASRARELARLRDVAGHGWLSGLWRPSLYTVGGAVALLLVAQVSTAVVAGWTLARTAGLLAALVVAGVALLAAYHHRRRGGLLAPLLGEDNRLSTSRVVAAGWVSLLTYATLVLALELGFASGGERRQRLLDGMQLERAAGVLTVLALTCAVAVFVRRTVTVRIAAQRLQKVRADRPHAADLLTDDSGRGSFADIQYVLLNGVAWVFCAVRLARQPERVPDLPWGLALLVLLSTATYLAAKYAEGGRPVITSVVRARELGALDGPLRPGDDIEIRGAGFVPSGAGDPDRLSRVAVRVGAVHVSAPLIPEPRGFGNPRDAVLTVPVPAEVEPGRVEVQVVTAAGVETNRYPIEVLD
ncbi:hypothetical protein [Streptomyces sp. NPDC005438]|uniref:hypothetical protein n=1 Tax=Streptomyces sp. NPDC005438 TaxID=3156880 RepID=UPI0033B14D77